MPSEYNQALSATATSIGSERGMASRRDLERALAETATFRPTYTVLQRMADGVRPFRVFELGAFADVLDVEPHALLPDVKRHAQELQNATLELTVDQIAGLSMILGLDQDEVIDKITAAIEPVAARAAADRRRHTGSTPAK